MTIRQQGGVFGRNPSFANASAEKLNVDNVQVDGNTISTTDTNGNLILAPNGTGLVRTSSSISLLAGRDFRLSTDGSGFLLRDASASREVLRGTLAGDISLPSGNLVVTSGKGIDFSATAGTGTSELFNDYEEGTWTPDIFFGDSEVGDFTIVRQAGRYTKIGRAVYVKVYVEWSAIPTSGQLLRFNLPFTGLNTGGVYSPDALYPGSHVGTFSSVIGGAVVLGNSALAQVFTATTGTSGSYNYTQVPASGNFLFSGVYEAQ